ncbi:sugar-phosphatase [Lactobacillus sp. LC28-10]|uniref:Sugar-phosphatase n=1 Tax=Secundilactobacillus angelensis TaxID=2722706 RepID=A0ABX1L035_9LACO|nr:sugar-phosphatase [Secundilactobacillus angelensis]MCH5463068.1 sugar-phosphatase [Secundilactobacillus angelensis]NLR18875.1 sugar-phosphatase [Secundilactobacillus angelensis]
MAIKLIAIDIDGTLVTDNKELTQHTIDTITKARQKGIKVVLCTGRPITGVQQYLNPLDISGDDEYVVTFNGSLAQTIAGTPIVSHNITLEDYIDLETLARKSNIHFHMETLDHIYTANRDISPYTIAESFIVRMPIRYRTPEEITDELTISKGMFIDEPQKLSAFIESFPADLKERFYVVQSEPYFFEAMNKKASKGNAIAELATKLGFTADEVMALGDQGNDLTMVKYAGTGVAMGNAIDEVKAAAQFITQTNEEDGVAYAIEKFAL